MVDDLLDVSRLAGGKVQLRPEAVELAAILHRGVETARPLIMARRHDLTVNLPRGAVWLDADPVRLAQVFANLLTNAAKYTDVGGRITVTAEKAEGWVAVTVADTGVGIPADMLPRLFELFTQSDRSLDRSQGGLGIGLSLVKALVELHGGTVEARSDGPGKGSAFTVRLPVRASGEDFAVNGAAADGPARPRRVLIVDDNPDAADTLALILRARGHLVRTASDGPSALTEAAAFRPEVVLLDIGLPGMDGYEVARRLRAMPEAAGATLAALTGYNRDEDRRRAAEAGFDRHLTKPADPMEVQKLLVEPGASAAG
jgi:CheY-like chemotaxis protein/two-component sensor histidine kinase